jgi:hypothetical protein
MNSIELSKIENMIYVVRGQKVLLDSDLAKLYEVGSIPKRLYVSVNL